MKRTRQIGALVGLVAAGVFAADAPAMYDPGMGRFLQRDPGQGAMRVGAAGPALAGGFIPMDQYRDGPNLYQNVGGNPVNYVDPSGLWKSGGHKTLMKKSYDRFWQWRAQVPGAGANPGQACTTGIYNILEKANVSQDSGQAFKENFRHYNRDLKEAVAGAKQKFQDYIAKEIGWFNGEMKKVDGKCDTEVEKQACINALWDLGRVSHTWQDYYAHAVLASNGKAGPAWAANPPITGSPDNDNDALKPSSWGSLTNWGEHGGTEPASRDKPGGEAKRKTGAEDFVFEKYKAYLNTWYNKCWCCCPEK